MAVLEVLTDTAYQTALWTGNVEGEQSSFTEAVCMLFDDSALGIELDSGVFERTHSQELFQSVCRLRMLLREIDDTGTPAQTLQHPKMREVREAALELRKLFTDYPKHAVPS